MRAPKKLYYPYRKRVIYWQSIGTVGGWKIHGVEMLPMRTIRECREIVKKILKVQ